ncbi:MAG: RNA 3'-terminal phosphate cyclase, partial [Planctomycetota bacterium]|nr:RNA 3'-terminal phosphate cyclase [Planctomycetota bacterium]
PSTLTLEGGTHNSKAPPFDFLEKTFLPLLARMGPRVSATLERHGFYPAGGGRFTVRIEPAAKLTPLDLPERGEVAGVRVRALLSQLPREIGEREAAAAARKIGFPHAVTKIEEIARPQGPGNVLLVEIASAHVTEVVSAYGEKGTPAEDVAAEAAREARHYLDADVPVGEHLADQLMLPMALAGGGRYRTVEPSLHAQTNVDTIAAFLPVRLKMTKIAPKAWEVTLS